MSVKERTAKIKSHFREHKTVYIVGTSCLAVGAVIGLTMGRGGIQIVDSGKLIHLQWKSPNTYETILVRRGHPGNIVRCVETGELFASQQRAAEMTGVNPSALSKHLKGVLPNAGGRHFEKLGEAA